MKKIYKVTLTQGFNAHKRKETSSMDIFLNRTRYEKEICYHHVTGREKYIYTESEKQAKLLYEKRYPVSKIDSIINSFLEVGMIMNIRVLNYIKKIHVFHIR